MCFQHMCAFMTACFQERDLLSAALYALRVASIPGHLYPTTSSAAVTVTLHYITLHYQAQMHCNAQLPTRCTCGVRLD